MKSKLMLLVCAATLLLSCIKNSFQFTGPVTATTIWTVDDDGPADFRTIQEAINAAAEGDTIFVYNGSYYENVIVDKTVTLVGEHTETTIIDGNGGSFAVKVNADNTVLKAFTIKNGSVGVYLDESFNCSIVGNYIVKNIRVGVHISGSVSNTFYHNNLIKNGLSQYYSKQVESDYSSVNFWDNGYPSGGNYWSDHNPPDGDMDKIGDVPYKIDENNTDRYPLVYPFEFYAPGYTPKPDLNRDGIVNILDVISVGKAYGSKPGDPKWNPTADMDTNEVINIVDLAEIAKSYSNSQPARPPFKYELGIWSSDASFVASIPEATVVFTDRYSVRPRPDLTMLLGDYTFHTSSITSTYLADSESKYKAVVASNFDGVIFLGEEVYCLNIAIENGASTTWFGEQLVGSDIYGGAKSAWQKEMYLRMLRGFANYWHGQGKKVGITMHYDCISNPDYFYGTAGYNYILANYDFVVLYIYTNNLSEFTTRTKPYFTMIDGLPAHLKKYWILTRPWYDTWQTWEREAIGLEMKNCLDMKMAITTYGASTFGYSVEETWSLMLKSIELYRASGSYYEEYVFGENLLTGIFGNTYGWASILSSESDLIGYWKLDEGSGTKVCDSSPYHNNGSIIGASWVSGGFGYALRFDGYDDYVDCGKTSILNIAKAMTIELWIMPATVQETGPHIGVVAKAQSGVSWSWQIRYGNPTLNNQLGFQVNDLVKGGTWVSVKQDLIPSIWYHVVCRFNGTYISMYLNGYEKDANSVSGMKSSNCNFYIGQDGWQNFFEGTIAEVKIYNRALTQEEIKEEYLRGIR